MANNQLSGQLTDQLGEFKNLAYLSLAHNNISGPIPLSIRKLSSLETLDLGRNQLEGVVSEAHFSNLTRLTTLKASKNMLSFEPNRSWIPPFQCDVIELGYWHLGPMFPAWLKFQKNLSDLDICGAGISDVIPTWFWNLSTQFRYLNISSNQLTGGISYLNVTTFVDLSSNRFTGPLPRVLPDLQFLILSNNSFSGSLFELVCNSSVSQLIWMRILYLDTNLLSGEVPNCWDGWLKLSQLNLRNNNLTGKIPPSLERLQVLNLRNNSMFGELASTLLSRGLYGLDLSENQFSGSIPSWIGDEHSELVVLRLRSNKFDGHIPDKLCALKTLQNLDLAHNNISGSIPKCFSRLNAMAAKVHRITSWKITTDYTFLYFGASLVLKGREAEYSTTLGLVTSMDLSANSLTGEIPKELGTLIGLRSLNLSGNLLVGNVPDNIGNMESLESLDLSMNRLNGGIPSSFSKLNFLNHFNVSNNNLTGQIPTSTQLQSFENSSYLGNHLCGPPLTKSCTTKVVPNNNGGSSEESTNESSKVNGVYVSIVVGFVMGFWGVVAPLFFIRSWRHAYYQKLDHVGSKLYVFWATLGK